MSTNTTTPWWKKIFNFGAPATDTPNSTATTEESGPMTPKEIELVQSTFAKVAPIADDAAAIFYATLFEMDPSLKPLFKADLKEQGAKLMKTLALAVNGLTNLEALVPVVQDLGRRHVGYGVTDPMYDTVAAALLSTLEKGLGEAWNDEVKAAWTTAYVTLATVMKEAAAEVESA